MLQGKAWDERENSIAKRSWTWKLLRPFGAQILLTAVCILLTCVQRLMFVSIVWLLLADVLWICISALHSRSGSSLPGNSTNSKNHDDEVCVFVKRSVRGAPRFTVQTLRRRCLLFWRSFSRRKRLVMQKQILIKRAQRHSQVTALCVPLDLRNDLPSISTYGDSDFECDDYMETRDVQAEKRRE